MINVRVELIGRLMDIAVQGIHDGKEIVKGIQMPVL